MWQALYVLAAALAAVGAVVVWIIQPDPTPTDLGALVAVAGLLGTVLSLGLTVTLLVAQHTAERHAQAIYTEFRRERTWTWGLALLGASVAAIVAAALLRPTISTAWAALSLAVALGLLAASQFPRLLDSLDRIELARRLTDRILRRLEHVGRVANPLARQRALELEATRGLRVAASLLTEGVRQGDGDGVREGFASIRRILLGYLTQIPSDIGMGDGVVLRAFQHLEVAFEQCVAVSPVVILPMALEEVTVLATDAAALPNRLSDYEPVSMPLNGLLTDTIASTLTTDKSAAAAMAAHAIGEGGVALVAAGRPTNVTDHLRRLRSVALAGLSTGRDHVTGQAMHELACIAVALTSSDPQEIMPPQQYLDACEAMAAAVDAFLARPSAGSSLMHDTAMTPVTGPLAEPTLTTVIVAGAQAQADGHHRGEEYRWGAETLLRSLSRLASADASGVMTPVWALDCAYATVVRGFAGVTGADLADQVSAWWQLLWQCALTTTGGKRAHDFERLAAALLLLAVESAHGAPSPLAMQMREALRAALQGTIGAAEATRTRVIGPWAAATAAALERGENGLADSFVEALRDDLRALQSEHAGTFAGVVDSYELYPPSFGLPTMEWLVPRRSHRGVEQLEALLASKE